MFMQDLFSLDGKTALVTGASGGIGRAVAAALHGAGATVVLSGTRQDVLEAAVADFGARAHALTGNLASEADVESLVPGAETVAGPVDILVNNAGLTRDGLLLRMKDEDWQTVLDVNLTAMFRLSRAALRGMMKRRFGRIVNISSVAGVTGNVGQTNYAASKAGMIGFSKSLAREVAARGITVNCIAPGFIETPMTDELPEEARARLLAAIPQARFGTPLDVAAAVLYLASGAASYVTGQTLHVNGGMAML